MQEGTWEMGMILEDLGNLRDRWNDGWGRTAKEKRSISRPFCLLGPFPVCEAACVKWNGVAEAG